MKKILPLLIVILLSGFTFSQKKDILFEYDYARFKNDDTSSFFDLYYVIYQNKFVKATKDKIKTIDGILGVTVEKLPSKEIVLQKVYKFSTEVGDSTKSSLVGHLPFQFNYGDYRCVIEVADKNVKAKKDSVSFSFSLQKSGDNFSISDIEIADTIYESKNDKSTFYRNTYEVLPNPSGIFGQNKQLLYFYSELYNLTKNVGSPELKFKQTLLNSSNKVVFTRTKTLNRKNNNIVRNGVIPVNTFPSGSYTIQLSLLDSALNLNYTSSKKIFIFNPNVVDTSTNVKSDIDFLSSEFASMGDEEVDESFAVAEYLATKGEVKQWKTINDIQGKRNFLFNFWKTRDKLPETPQNEEKQGYYTRLDYVNLNFSSFKKKGWKTDRGRVYLQYGVPSEIEKNPSQLDTKPYEVWKYDEVDGGVIFVFADLTGFGDYQVIHSTMRGELRDELWKRRIQSSQDNNYYNGSSSSN